MVSYRTSAWCAGLASVCLLGSACGAERSGLGDDTIDGGPVVDPFGHDGGLDSSLGDGGNAGGNGNGNGNGKGNGNGGGGGSTVCNDYPIPALTQVPEVLLVVDRSGSMKTIGVDRWDPSISAVNTTVGQLEPKIRFGLMTFPGDCNTLPAADQFDCFARAGSPDQSLSCETGRIDVAIGDTNASAISGALNATAPGGATPTAASLAVATKALTQMAPLPNEGSKSILLVTDGAPNCSLGVSGLLAVGLSVGTANQQLDAVVQTVSAIQAADQAGIRTYVIGYQTDGDPLLAGALDQMAQAGGTGAMQHLKVEDQTSLLSALSTLSQNALNCEVKLGAPANDPTLLLVTLSGQPVANDPVDGYTLSTDKQTVTLHGKSCAAVEANPGAGIAHAQILCPPPPPPPPPGSEDAGAPGGNGPGPVDAGAADAGGPPGVIAI